MSKGVENLKFLIQHAKLTKEDTADAWSVAIVCLKGHLYNVGSYLQVQDLFCLLERESSLPFPAPEPLRCIASQIL